MISSLTHLCFLHNHADINLLSLSHRHCHKINVTPTLLPHHHCQHIYFVEIIIVTTSMSQRLCHTVIVTPKLQNNRCRYINVHCHTINVTPTLQHNRCGHINFAETVIVTLSLSRHHSWHHHYPTAIEIPSLSHSLCHTVIATPTLSTHWRFRHIDVVKKSTLWTQRLCRHNNIVDTLHRHCRHMDFVDVWTLSTYGRCRRMDVVDT